MNFKRIKYLFFFFTLFINTNIKSQEIYEDILNSNIYNFLDDLANDKIITLNSCIKPYSKKIIIKKLIEASKNQNLNNNHKREIDYYLNKYQEYIDNDPKKNLFFKEKSIKLIYKDYEQSIIIKPIWGITKKVNTNGEFQHLLGGISSELNFKKWSFYAKLIDNTMSEPIASPNYFTTTRGGNYKLYLNNDYSEMRGGIIYSFKKGSIGLVKENIEWGDNYFGSNILSARNPSFPLIKLNLEINKYINLNYIHGWLVSEDIDSSRSYFSTSGNYRAIFRDKFIASNFFSLNVSQHTIFSFGNSIIYGDINGVNPAYLIPFFFYKSIDHTLNNRIENQNSQLFFNFSFREIKHVHLYSSLFVDEFKKDRIFIDSLNNFLSLKIGLKVSNWPFYGISNLIEVNQTNPMTYQHTVEGTSFESNQFNLGHYMRDNSKVLNYQLSYKINNRNKLIFDYMYLMHGDDVIYNYNYGYNPIATPILENKTWDNTTFKIAIQSEIKEDIFLYIEYLKTNINGYESEEFSSQYYLNKFTPDFYHGDNNTWSASLRIGF